MSFLSALFSSEGFMPHGACYLWNSKLLWLHLVSDSLIALSYMTIPFTLIYFVRKRRDLAFSWMFVCFGIFIVACGFTHIMEIWTIWNPSYWLSGTIKALTAAASVPTAILLARMVPQALTIPSPEDLRKEIAERKNAEDELRNLNLNLERRSTALEIANKELESFAYSVSHDLRAPLRHIDGFARLLADRHGPELPAESNEYLGLIRESAQEMGRLVDDLLNLARVTRKELSVRETGLRSIAQEVVIELTQANPSRAIDWRVSDLPSVECDPTLMKQVYGHLLSNAVKFTRPMERAEIEIGSVDRGGTTVFYVRDNGVGFNMKTANKLFGVFQRLHRPEDFEGTGVGLAIIQRIVEKHGGRVWAESELNRGATFYFTVHAERKAA